MYSLVIRSLLVWLFHFSQCFSDCGHLPNISYGAAYGNGTTTVGVNATVNCSLGYNASSPIVTCQHNGSWSSVSCIPQGKLYIQQALPSHYVQSCHINQRTNKTSCHKVHVSINALTNNSNNINNTTNNSNDNNNSTNNKNGHLK